MACKRSGRGVCFDCKQSGHSAEDRPNCNEKRPATQAARARLPSQGAWSKVGQSACACPVICSAFDSERVRVGDRISSAFGARAVICCARCSDAISGSCLAAINARIRLVRFFRCLAPWQPRSLPRLVPSTPAEQGGGRQEGRSQLIEGHATANSQRPMATAATTCLVRMCLAVGQAWAQPLCDGTGPRSRAYRAWPQPCRPGPDGKSLLQKNNR